MELDFLPVTIIRLVVPLLILKRPIPGLAAAIYVDWADWRMLDLDNRPASHQEFYQSWDKVLDTYYLGLLVLASFKWESTRARRLGMALFSYRLVGVGVLAATGSQIALFAFPNVFENFFVFVYVYRWVFGQEPGFEHIGDMALVVVAILVPQLARELFLHVLQDRPWDMVRLSLFGVTNRTVDVLFWYGVYLAPQFAALFFVRPSGEMARDPALQQH